VSQTQHVLATTWRRTLLWLTRGHKPTPVGTSTTPNGITCHVMYHLQDPVLHAMQPSVRTQTRPALMWRLGCCPRCWWRWTAWSWPQVKI
jgi:hypothetical protein